MKAKKILHFQHACFEGLGQIKAELEQRGFLYKSIHWYLEPFNEDLEEYHALILSGGPMAVHDQKRYPWLIEEKKILHRFMASRKAVLGICLGAQLIAEISGARVYKNHETEIGWFTVEQVGNPRKAFPQKINVLHWHGDTFDLPSGAEHLYRSKACENQAFVMDNRILGLQFHLEMGRGEIASMVRHCKKELVPGKWIQEEKTILTPSGKTLQACGLLLKQFIEEYI